MNAVHLQERHLDDRSPSKKKFGAAERSPSSTQNRKKKSMHCHTSSTTQLIGLRLVKLHDRVVAPFAARMLVDVGQMQKIGDLISNDTAAEVHCSIYSLEWCFGRKGHQLSSILSFIYLSAAWCKIRVLCTLSMSRDPKHLDHATGWRIRSLADASILKEEVLPTSHRLRPMKLTIDELRPLVATPEAVYKHIHTLQGVEAIDLSSGGIVGDQIAEFLRFISLSVSPVALRSIDLSRNRLGDVGTIAIVRLLQTSASKLLNLAALELFENGIRDEGALALVNSIQIEVAAGNLQQLSNVTLHDNDISESVLRAMDAMWSDMPLDRALGWRRAKLPVESASLGFAELLKREIELTKATHVTLMAEVLEPLITFLKRILWHAITRGNKHGGKLELNIFAAPTIARSIMALSKEQIEKIIRQRAIERCDPHGILLPLKARAAGTDTESLIDALLAQMSSLIASITDAKGAVGSLTIDGQRCYDMEFMSAVLSTSLGLPVTISATTRYWHIDRSSPNIRLYESDSSRTTSEWYDEEGNYFPPSKVFGSEFGYRLTCEASS